MLWFPCHHCHANLSAEASAAGTRLLCARCGKHTVIPPHSLPPAADDNQLADNEALPTDTAEYRRRLVARFAGNVPPEVQALGELLWFGACSRPPTWLLALRGWVPIIAGLFFFHCGLFFSMVEFDLVSDSMVWAYAFWCGIALIAYGLFAWQRYRGVVNCTLAACTDGFVCWMRGAMLAYGWEELREVWLRIEPARPLLYSFFAEVQRPVRRRYLLVLADGRDIALPPDLPGLEDFGPLLRRKLLQHRYPVLAAELAAGATLNFGSLVQLEPSGLVCRRSLLTWDELDEVLVDEDGMVEVFARRMCDPWHRIPAGEVANLALLMELANETAERRREASGK